MIRQAFSVIQLLGFSLMSLFWGLTWLPTKLATQVVPPVYLASVRFLVAAPLFFALARAMGRPVGLRRPGRMVLTALLIVTGSYALIFWGLAHAPSNLAAIVNLSLMPVFLVGLGVLHGEDVMTRWRAASIVVGICGLALLFLTRPAGTSGPGLAAGLAAILAGTVCYAWGAVLSRPLLREMAPVAVASWQSLLGGIALLPLSLALEGWSPARLTGLADPRVYGGLATLILGGSIVASTIYLWLVRDWGPFRAGLYAFVSPVIAVAIGTVWAGEPFAVPEALGMGVMLSATALALRSSPVSASATTGSSPARPA